MKKHQTMPVCIKCGALLKGYVPAGTKITCFFCSNPRFDDADTENTALKSNDVRK